MKELYYKHIERCAEIDPKAFASAKVLLGIEDAMNLWDVRNVLREDLSKVTCIVAGFPCQSVSSIGEQAGISNTCLDCGHTFSPLDVDVIGVCPVCGSTNIEETPSSLVAYVLEAIKKIRPPLVVMENVSNFATSRKFRTDFEKINAKIKSFGYNLYWKVLNARDYGSVQNRRRVIWVCVRSDVDAGFEFPEPYGVARDLQTILEDCSDVFANTDARVVIDSSISPYVRDTIEKYVDEIITSDAETLKLPCKSGWADHVIGLKKIPTLRASNSTCIVRQVYKDADGNNRYYIKKLTPKERWLATGFTAEDYEKVSKINCKTQLNHQTGNSICIEMLVAVWWELFKRMPYLFENLDLLSLFQGVGAFERSLDILYSEINLYQEEDRYEKY